METIEKLNDMVLADLRLRLPVIMEAIGFEHGSVVSILDDHCCVRKVSARWVVCLLSNDHKHSRVVSLKECLVMSIWTKHGYTATNRGTISNRSNGILLARRRSGSVLLVTTDMATVLLKYTRYNWLCSKVKTISIYCNFINCFKDDLKNNGLLGSWETVFSTKLCKCVHVSSRDDKI